MLCPACGAPYDGRAHGSPSDCEAELIEEPSLADDVTRPE